MTKHRRGESKRNKYQNESNEIHRKTEAIVSKHSRFEHISFISASLQCNVNPSTPARIKTSKCASETKRQGNNLKSVKWLILISVRETRIACFFLLGGGRIYTLATLSRAHRQMQNKYTQCVRQRRRRRPQIGIAYASSLLFHVSYEVCRHLRRNGHTVFATEN